WSDDVFLFGSELKSLAAHPAWRGEIDRNAARLLMRYSYVPAPHCIYKGIKKLEPGMTATMKWAPKSSKIELLPYWSTSEMVRPARVSPLRITETDALDEFERLFRNAVGMRMEADVPLGAFLSGGFDSAAVVAMMQLQASRPVKTFTIGFKEPGYNE